MYRLSHRNIGLLICCYRGSLILGIMHVYLTAHMREGISARPGVTGGVTGSGGTSNTTSDGFCAWAPLAHQTHWTTYVAHPMATLI